MNQLRIGRFIAECRKEKKLTQSELADVLGITDKAVSKWERGIAMPDTSLMLVLCDTLGISVNELLKGEKTVMENNSQCNDGLLLDLAKELERKNKVIWTNMLTIMIVSIVSLFAGLFIAAFLIPEGVWQLVTVIGICVVFLIPCFYALRLDVSVGAYKCKKCGDEIVPTYKEALNAMHLGFTRYLKCPRCNKRRWCKKIIIKEEDKK